MFEEGLVGDALYAALIASKLGFEFVVPILLALTISYWNIETTV